MMDYKMYKRGNIYLAKLYPSKGNEVGKKRPVVVLQTDILNTIGHTTLIILPLTTQLVDESYPLRYRLSKREALTEDSEVLCDQIRTISTQRLEAQKIATLTEKEMLHIQEQVAILLEI